METIQFACPKCSQQLLISIDQAGQPCKCTTCAAVVTSPPNFRQQRRAEQASLRRRVSIHPEATDSCGETIQGIWRDGTALVVSPFAKLPRRCIYTNERSLQFFDGHLAWHEAWVYVLLVAGIFVYFIAALFMTKRMNVRYYLGRAHLNKRAIGWTIIGAGSVFAFAVAIIVPTMYYNRFEYFAAVFISCCVVFVLSLVVCAFYSSPLRVRRIEGQYAWIDGVHPDYLDALPKLPTFDNTYGDRNSRTSGEQT